MEALWENRYILAAKEQVEASIALGGKVCPPMMLKELLSKNKNKYIKMAKLKGAGAHHVMCGCLAKSNTLPLSCIDDLQLRRLRDKPEDIGKSCRSMCRNSGW